MSIPTSDDLIATLFDNLLTADKRNVRTDALNAKWSQEPPEFIFTRADAIAYSKKLQNVREPIRKHCITEVGKRIVHSASLMVRSMCEQEKNKYNVTIQHVELEWTAFLCSEPKGTAIVARKQDYQEVLAVVAHVFHKRKFDVNIFDESVAIEW